MNMINSIGILPRGASTSDAPDDEYQTSPEAERDIATMERADRIIERAIKLLEALPEINALISLETPDEIAVILRDYVHTPRKIRKEIIAEDRARFYNERED